MYKHGNVTVNYNSFLCFNLHVRRTPDAFLVKLFIINCDDKITVATDRNEGIQFK